MEKPLAVETSPAEDRQEPGSLSFFWVLALFAVTLGMWVGLLASAQVLLPGQIEALDPSRKVWALGIVTTSGAIAAVIAAPVMGALSDRTSRRFGRRRSWVIGGTASCVAALLFLPWQSSIVTVGVCWTVIHGGAGGIHAILCAVVPDRVPVYRRGTVFAVVGFAQPLGLVLGTLLATGFSFEEGYLVTAVVVGLLAVPYAIVGRDAPGPAARASPMGRTSGLTCLGGDFAWAWAGRFTAQFATTLATIYLLYFLRDGIRMEDPVQGVAVLSLLYTVGVVVVSLLVGRVSDRLQRRKAFVILAGFLMASALAAMALVPTWTTAMAAATVLGAGYGAYLAVDQALVTQILRNDHQRGKDLGTMNMANSGAVAVAPIVAADAVGNGGYPLLFLIAAGMAVLGGLLVQPIRSVT